MKIGEKITSPLNKKKIVLDTLISEEKPSIPLLFSRLR